MVFEHFDIVPHVNNHALFIWCLKCKTTTVCKRISLVTGESTPVNPSLFSIYWIAKTRFSTHFLIETCLMRKTFLRIIRELNLLSFWWKNYRFLWNFFLAIFMGNPSIRLSEVLWILMRGFSFFFFGGGGGVGAGVVWRPCFQTVHF